MSRVSDKHSAEKELKENGVRFGWLTNVSSNFNINSYKKSEIVLEYCTLYRNPKSFARVVQVNKDFYYLTSI
jgi:hypothetical protein